MRDLVAGGYNEVDDAEEKPRCFTGLMKKIFTTQEDEITCDDCFDHIDQYVDLLQAGEDPAKVLPQVKQHLEMCQCCETEFKALITILEAGQADTDDPASQQ
jgi:hypothetical protein